MLFTLFLQKKLMRIVLIGTGNVATRLGLALHAKNAEIIQIFGRSAANASQLAASLQCPYTVSKSEIKSDADLYILAVSDDAIAEVAAMLPTGGDRIILHTAGSVPMGLLDAFSANYGVLYPLQTLSRQKEIDFSNVPICIEANTPSNLEKLRVLAATISAQVVVIDSDQRRQLHLAAVFVCNFVNHLYAIGDELVREQRLDFELLKPLILETASKVTKFSPHEVQTGPAIRGNNAVIDGHLKMLEQHPGWQKLYELLSMDISKTRGGLGSRDD
jgi:predicted short-subunit dehydrogenase-like oxidoreductase (DUF2520 family)